MSVFTVLIFCPCVQSGSISAASCVDHALNFVLWNKCSGTWCFEENAVQMSLSSLYVCVKYIHLCAGFLIDCVSGLVTVLFLVSVVGGNYLGLDKWWLNILLKTRLLCSPGCFTLAGKSQVEHLAGTMIFMTYFISIFMHISIKCNFVSATMWCVKNL